MRIILGSVLSLVSFFLLSCKKNKAAPVDHYEMTLKKDGISETLIPYYCSIKKSTTVPTRTDFLLSARSADNKVSFGIAVQVTGNITPGTYETAIGSSYFPVTTDYFVDIGQPAERDYTIDNAPGKPNSYFRVTIISIEDKVVKGTFSGNYLYDRNYDESIIISEGIFVAKRH